MQQKATPNLRQIDALVLLPLGLFSWFSLCSFNNFKTSWRVCFRSKKQLRWSTIFDNDDFFDCVIYH